MTSLQKSGNTILPYCGGWILEMLFGGKPCGRLLGCRLHSVHLPALQPAMAGGPSCPGGLWVEAVVCCIHVLHHISLSV